MTETSPNPVSDGMSGREAAQQAIVDALSGQRFVHETLALLRRSGFERRELGLATEIAMGTVRHALTIERVLSAVGQYDPRRVTPPLRAVLLAGCYETIWMDRTPVFAAVDQAVELARRQVGQRATGMVNALLRNVTRAMVEQRVAWRAYDPTLIRVNWTDACAFGQPILPAVEEPGRANHLAAATGERASRIASLIEQHGAATAEQIAWASQAVPVTVLYRNPLRINAGVFQARVRETFGSLAAWTPDAAYLPANVNAIDTALFQEGRAYVQDTTAHDAALLLDLRPGQSVLDLCAAPGGKSIVLAQQMNDRGEVLACDAAADRLPRVRENARRLRMTCIRTHLIQNSDASEADLRRQFDAALVDVPCSNSGVFARRPEARLGLTEEKIRSLVALQGALLRKAAACVRPGGRLVYSTCSIEPEENEQVVEAFLTQQSEWKLETTRATLPGWGPRLSDWRDGGFAALLTHT